MSAQNEHQEEDTFEEEYIRNEDILEEELIQGEEPVDNDRNELEEWGLEEHDPQPAERDNTVAVVPNDAVQGFFGHRGPVYSIAMHPKDSALIVSGGGDEMSYLWRADTGEKLFELGGHTDTVTAVAFSMDGEFVASAGMDGKVRVWRSHTGEFCTSVEGPDEVVWIDWHPKATILLAGASDSTVWMWAMPSGRFMNVFNGHAAAVSAGRFTPDGKKIVSVSEDSSLIVWGPKTASALLRISGEDARFHSEPITSVAMYKDSTLLITGSVDGKARLVNITSGQIVASLDGHTDSIETIDFCYTLTLAATGSTDGKICVWDVQSHRLRHTMSHSGAVVKVKFVHNSPLLVSCSVDRSVKMWDTRTGQCLYTWHGHRDTVLDFAVSNDAQTVVTASDDGTCLVFRV